MPDQTAVVNGNSYGDGTSRPMKNGGAKTWFLSLANDMVAEADRASDAADDAEAASSTAQAYAAALQGTSTTSLTIGTGSKVFTTQSGKQWSLGQRLRAASDDGTKIMDGEVTGYTGTTLTLSVDYIESSGTHADWNIGLIGPEGPEGPQGTAGVFDIVYESQTSTYSVVSADKARYLDFSGTFTATFAAPASLGANWWCYARNTGTGDITVAHTSGNIDGLNSYVMYPGECRLFMCDGSTVRSIVIMPFYKTFTTSGTFIKPPGYRTFSGYLWAGAPSGARSGSSAGAGGAGGAACVDFNLDPAVVGTTETVTIGAGGAAYTGTSSGNAGNNSSLGALVIAYTGGRGAAIANAAGGGGGGAISAGGDASSTTPGTAGDGGGTTSTANNTDAPSGLYGGGGGAATNGTKAGSSVYGGGGGGAVSGAGALRTPGSSVFGGAGGAAGDSSNGSPGTAPGGAGGSTRTGSQAGAGGRGELRIWGY